MSKPANELLRFSGLANFHDTVLAFCEPADTARDALLKELMDGLYTKPFLVEESGCRALCFALDGSAQTEMRLEEPDALATEYTRKMMGFLVFQSEPQHVVLIGLGGGALVKYCHRHLPDTRVTAIEINPDVIALRAHFYIPADDERLQVIQADGAQYLAQMAERGEQADVLLIDAYNHAGIAQEVVNQSFIETASQVLGERGLLVMNLVAGPRDCERYLDKIRGVFGEAPIVIPMLESGNLVVFAGRVLADSNRMARALETFEQVESRFGLHFPTLLKRLRRRASIRRTPSLVNERSDCSPP